VRATPNNKESTISRDFLREIAETLGLDLDQVTHMAVGGRQIEVYVFAENEAGERYFDGKGVACSRLTWQVVD
jgi:hypothetical protein